jgi:ketosteroid isomerase-like protein
MSEKISIEQVKAEVRRFWGAFGSKDSQGMLRFYAAGATVFNSSSSRQELGPVSAARRSREYFQPRTTVRVRVGDIRVDLTGERGDVAVATYIFQFHASGMVTASGVIDEDIQLGRATHIFVRGEDGNLQIVHEHLSQPTWPLAGVMPAANLSDAAVYSTNSSNSVSQTT